MHDLIFRVGCGVLAAAVLVGCNEQVMQSYVGKDITAPMMDYGPPTSSFRLPDGKTAFQWQFSSAYAMPMTTTYTGVQSGAVTTGTAISSGGMFTSNCTYTLIAEERSAGQYTVVGYNPPTFECM